MKVNEIFYSIEGEGIRAGELTTFIRLSGCNLRCKYCDTTYAFTEGTEMCIEDIMDEVGNIGILNVTLTGGEPLIHKDIDRLIDVLIENGYRINIETNGSVDITKYLEKDLVITMDYKTPESGEEEKMILSNLEALRKGDVLKFVMGSSDKDRVFYIINRYKPKSYIYLSPIFGEIDPKELVDFQKVMRLGGIDVTKIRTQLQLHKYIWDPNTKGV